MNMIKPDPAEFFDGVSLEFAKLIQAGDVDRMRRLAPQLDLNRIHRQGMTFLLFALAHQEEASVYELVRAGADPRQRADDLGAPLDLAVRAQDPKFLKAMLDAGVDPNAHDAGGLPILFEAACKESQHAMRLLVAEGADLNAKDALDKPVIYQAFSQLRYDQVEFLIEKGADVHFRTANGVTMGYSLERRLSRAERGTPAFQKLNAIKRLCEQRGVRFPADPPALVRQKMKSEGLRVVE